ncbi:nucleotidyltransferase substrate binding protein [Geotalea sp. SG265]|uniref:nucleotidyltransferase substrate binding protein n=1 Tax=Geotalea sp. SG265 TaxID=2922867 RepID=UPI001FAF9B75|nr:nucleotidyltransferase substrate binding protein [Geotalea sp. SG265]
MDNLDVRWRQRFSNYQKALKHLEQVVKLCHERQLSDIEKQGLVKAFEFTYELAWNVMRDYFTYQGNVAISGSRDAIREAFKRGLIVDGEGWMKMITSRNNSSHTYNEEIADVIVSEVVSQYFELFQRFNERIQGLVHDE